MHSGRGDARVANGQQQRPPGIEPVSQPDQESALLDFHAFIGG
jgi:hypothetical protein